MILEFNFTVKDNSQTGGMSPNVRELKGFHCTCPNDRLGKCGQSMQYEGLVTETTTCVKYMYTYVNAQSRKIRK